MKSKAGDFDGKIANADIQPLEAGDNNPYLPPPYGDANQGEASCPTCGKKPRVSQDIFPGVRAMMLLYRLITHMRNHGWTYESRMHNLTIMKVDGKSVYCRSITDDPIDEEVVIFTDNGTFKTEPMIECVFTHEKFDDIVIIVDENSSVKFSSLTNLREISLFREINKDILEDKS